MWKSVSIHILKNTQANKPYGTEDRQVRKTLKSAKFVKSAIQTKTNTDDPYANGTPLHSTPLECGYPAVSTSIDILLRWSKEHYLRLSCKSYNPMNPGSDN